MTAAIQQDLTLDDLKEQVLHDLDRYAGEIWIQYKVHIPSLLEEIEQSYWAIVVRRKGNREEEYHVLKRRGIGDTSQALIERKFEAIRTALTAEEVHRLSRKARDSIFLVALYMWSTEKADGPDDSNRLIKKAEKAEYLADYLDRIGKDQNAYNQRRKAKLLRAKAAGADIELPKRASGAIDKVRAIYLEIDKDGKPHDRKEYIDAGVEAGINPGTCAVQYARWKREKK